MSTTIGIALFDGVEELQNPQMLAFIATRAAPAARVRTGRRRGRSVARAGFAARRALHRELLSASRA